MLSSTPATRPLLWRLEATCPFFESVTQQPRHELLSHRAMLQSAHCLVLLVIAIMQSAAAFSNPASALVR
jgi:hypothetical protein